MSIRGRAQGHAVSAAPPFDAGVETLAAPTILLVDDDRDTRELLVTLMRMSGYATEACGTAEEALEHLKEQQFDFVLTDYMLPRHSGEWLLQSAAEEGLLDGTPALLVTAHPSPPAIAGVDVIGKPFDLDDLVDRVHERLDRTSRVRRRQQAVARGKVNLPRTYRDGVCPQPIELILYVSVHSRRSAEALETIRGLVERFQTTHVRVTVCDVNGNSTDQPPSGVTTVPADRQAGPRTFILGHISSPELLMELLQECEDPV